LDHYFVLPKNGEHVQLTFDHLKLYISQERDAFVKNTMEEITTKHILGIYGCAHAKALTSDNIKLAFKKTGVVPFNPGVITPEMLAPSKPTSIESHLPVPPATPMKLITKMIMMLVEEDDDGIIPMSTQLSTVAEDDSDNDEHNRPPSPSNAQKNR